MAKMIYSADDEISADEAASIALARQLMAEENLNTFMRLQEAYIYDNRAITQTSLTQGTESEIDPSIALALQLLEEESRPPISLNTDLDNMTYDEILQLEEHMGDVKQDRWSLRAKKVIQERCRVATCKELRQQGQIKDDLCHICQHDFSDNERLLLLPCKHVYHYGCASQWLHTHDTCCLCKKSIAETKV
jgi:hypothetical protein